MIMLLCCFMRNSPIFKVRRLSSSKKKPSHVVKMVEWCDFQTFRGRCFGWTNPLVFGDVFTQLLNVSPNLLILKMPPIILHNPRCLAFVRFLVGEVGHNLGPKNSANRSTPRFRVGSEWLVGWKSVGQKTSRLAWICLGKVTFLRMKITMNNSPPFGHERPGPQNEMPFCHQFF